MNSCRFLTGSVGDTIITGAKRVTIDTGARVPHPVVGQLLGDRGMHDAGRRMIEQRVSVRLGLHHGIGGDGAAGAALVLDENLLAQHAAERLRHHPRGGIDPAAGGKRNDELDRP